MRLIRKFIIVMIVLAVLLLPTQSVSAGTFTGQNGRVTFTKPGGGIWTVRQNGAQAQRLSMRTAKEMSWSPDGTQLAFVEPSQDGTTRLLVKNIATGATQSITRQSGISDSEPAWSHDGSHLAFVRTKQEPSGKQSALFTIKPNCSDLKNISGWSKDKTYRVPSWAPGGNRLAYREIGDGGAKIFIKNLANGSTRELTELLDTAQSPLLAWSPSGKKLLFNDSEGQIYTIWADGTHRAVISDGDSYSASWSPDGSRIAFLEDFSGESISVSEPDGTIRYIPLGLDGYNRVDNPVWSPDGKRLAFIATSTSTGERDLFSIVLANEARPSKVANDVAGVIAWQSKAE